MYILIGLLALAFIISFFIGYKRLIRLQHLNQKRVINGFIAAMILLTLMTIAQGLQLIPEHLVAQFTMLLYIAVSGFFIGFGIKMMLLREEVQSVEYIYRSFWTEAAPNIISILVMAYGIYQTGLLSSGPFTGIGITSGLSLLGFGFMGLTVRIVPEFRSKGILILDQCVPWQNVVAYSWESENVIQIDYYTEEEKLTDFTTFIPPEDQLTIEKLLGKKLKEHEQERKKMMDISNSQNG